jgi:hypothetical protein
VGCRAVVGAEGAGCGCGCGVDRALAGCRWLPADAVISLGREPVCRSGAGALTYGSRTVL